MSRSIAIFCLLACSATMASAAIAPASNCEMPEGGMMAGGWSFTRAVPLIVYTAIANTIVEGGNSTWVPCDDPTPTLQAACSQVVAGTNYQVVATLSCEDTMSDVEVAAEVFVPLPSMNEDPEVTQLEIIAVNGEQQM